MKRFEQKANAEVAALTLDVLDILPNIIQVKKNYFWRLITVDPDDNKFVDCAIAANADFIVTDDKHFKVLKTIEFPKVKVVGKKEFLEMLQTT
jgi:predicted nucleic acid-binding protein